MNDAPRSDDLTDSAAADVGNGQLEATLDELRADPALHNRRIELVELLGQGASSLVYRARDTRNHRDVAVKILRRFPGIELAGDRFLQEIRVAAGLRHAHVLPLFDSGTLVDGRPFSIMPVAQGRPLSAIIADGPLPVALAVQLTREMAQALGYVHAAGFLHRDVKPENILVESGHAVLTDFGIALSLNAVPSAAPPNRSDTPIADFNSLERMTRGGAFIGTIKYMSPEALFADNRLSVRSDIYSLGVVLYEMLTGSVPTVTSAPDSVLNRPANVGLPGLHEARPDIPSALAAIVDRCTALEPEFRYASAEELDAALARLSLTVGGPLGTTPATDTARIRWSMQRRIAAIATLAITISVVAWISYRQVTQLDPNRIVVADLVNDTGDSTAADIGVRAGDIIVAALVADTSLAVINGVVAIPSRFQRRLPPSDSVLAQSTREVVTAAGAGLVVTGTYFYSDGGLDVMVEVTDTRNSRLLGVVGPVHVHLSPRDAELQPISDSVLAIVHRR